MSEEHDHHVRIYVEYWKKIVWEKLSEEERQQYREEFARWLEAHRRAAS